MLRELQGYYFDGRTARRQQAVVRIRSDGLEIVTENGTVFWPFNEIQYGDKDTTTDEVHLERGGETPEILVVSASRLYGELRLSAPDRAAAHDPGRRRLTLRKVLFCAAGAAAIAGALFMWLIPGISSVVALLVPVSWEEKLGEEVVLQLAPEQYRCGDKDRTRVLDEIVGALSAKLPDNPYRFKLVVVNNPAVNALAAPGGHIIVFQGLLDHTRSADELAGVLAHEIHHIVRRHATKALLQQATMGILIAAVTGDSGGASSFGIEGARTLATLKYSRENEVEADALGAKLLIEAGINPDGMIAFFERLETANHKKSRVSPYLSTHPEIDQRIKRLRALTPPASGQRPALLPSYDWAAMREVCVGKPAQGQVGPR